MVEMQRRDNKQKAVGNARATLMLEQLLQSDVMYEGLLRPDTKV